MKEFIGLANPENRQESLERLTDLYDAREVNIFVKDPETDSFLPAPGLPQTIVEGKVWQKLLQSHASQHLSEKVYPVTLAGEQQHVTLIAYGESIIYSVVSGRVSSQQVDEIRKILPFLLEIFLHERREQYSKIRLVSAEQSVAENKHIANKLDITRRELRKSLIKVRDEMEAAKRAQEFKGRVDSLTRQRNDLMRLNEIKDEFISVASHQLRTPATVSKQYMGLLREGYAGELSPAQLQYLQTAYESNETQLAILNDLLKTAQLDSAHLVSQKKKLSLAPLIERIISQLSTTISLRNQTVVFEHPREDITALINEEEIKLAVANVIENASKYTPDGKKIVVELTSDGAYASLSITDEGVGIHEKNIDKIFDKFTRIDNELSDTVSGSGLGLYMVKRIIDLHSGHIDVESTVGKGSSFTMRLPV